MSVPTSRQTEASRDALQALFDATNANDTSRAAACMRALPDAITTRLPAGWIELNATALERRNYAGLSEPWARSEFHGPNGDFLLVAPYVSHRPTGDVSILSAVFGRVVPYRPTLNLAETLEAIQGAKLREAPSTFHQVAVMGRAGTLDQFLVGDSWAWRDSSLGPSLYADDAASYAADFAGRPDDEPGWKAIRRIFDADTADCLMQLMCREPGQLANIFRAYERHDVCHASGLGLTRKNREAVIPGCWYRAVEEWRADGLAFECAARVLSPLDAATTVAANFYARFGWDAATATGPDGPTEHTPCTLLMLDRLLRDGNLVVRHDRLALRDPTPDGLVRAMEPQRSECISLTRRELDLDGAGGILRLYGTVPLHQATVAVFETMMRAPTRGLHKGTYQPLAGSSNSTD